jgi:RHH-type proline utilization regulon transcriptional repressor/proline dehydrogenase/delta 1-pyrroline-5-carboxylate dehydrogenase
VIHANTASIEADVRRLAAQIAGAGTETRTEAFHLGSWSERMLDWAMAHPEFKTQLFRLVDVLPACRTDHEVLRHLDEYFDGVAVPRALDLGMDLAEHVPLGAAVTATVARRNVRRMARQFIAGATPEAARAKLERLWNTGRATTVDLLGEKVVADHEADRYAARLIELVSVLAESSAGWRPNDVLERDPWGPLPRVNVSVKPTALSPLFGPLTADEGLAQAQLRLAPLLELARSVPATVHLDTEHDDVKDLTHILLRRLADVAPEVQFGCVVQAYRKDAFSDLCDLVSWSGDHLRHPLQVRLVKGAYWDLETIVAGAEGWPVPVFEHKNETDANYERCVRYLIAHAGEVRPAIASHDLRSLAYALAASRAAGLDDGALEYQLLYGMAEPVHRALTSLGLRVRVYAPVGELVPGMGYLVRRLLENTSNEGFVRQNFAEGRPLTELIRPPGVDAAALPDADPDRAPRAPTDPDAPGGFVNEPHAELRRAGPRRWLLDAVRGFGTTPFDAPVLVDGVARPWTGEILSVDPASPSRIVCRSASASVADVDAAVDVAHAAWPAWRATSWEHRAAVLFGAAAIMRNRRAELAALEVFEAGKPIPEADADVCEAIDFCEYYGRHARHLADGAPVIQVPGERNSYRYEPRGVGAVIAPWNFPLAIPTGMVSAGLVTGNAVMFKPAEQTPGIALRMVEIFLEAGVPPGVLAFLPGDGEQIGPHLVEHTGISFVVFTGSKAVGLEIAERAARRRDNQHEITRVVAEMGGKNAIVVDDDADLDVAVPATVSSAFAYAGQKCSAASRVIVTEARLDELVERLVGAAALVPVGPASELRTVCSPLIEDDARARVVRYRGVAHADGEVVLERDDHPDEGWYVGPTVVVVRDPESAVVRDEIFGPLLAVQPVADWEEAVARANATDYALTAGLFSRSPSRIDHALRELRAGNVYVNRAITGARVGRQPFGGFGMSGVGSKAGGPDYLHQFVEPRSASENTVRQGFAPPPAP